MAIDFLNEDHKGSFHTKNYENLWQRLENISQKHSKIAILAKNFKKKLTIFCHFEGQKILEQKFFWWSSKSYGDTTSCKKLEKNIERSRL